MKTNLIRPTIQIFSFIGVGGKFYNLKHKF
jgi:hypothetical protein